MKQSSIHYTSIRIILLAFIFSSCAPSYYQNHYTFNSAFEKGDLDNALLALELNEREAQSKTRFLYYLNRGLTLSVLGKYKESNDYFEKAFVFGEDYRINYINEAASYLSNPHMTVYRGEDHEHLLLLYFKALNFLKLGQPENALVECRRLNIRLQQLSDKYQSERKFQRDAFVHTLMGIIYQSTSDFNNAFIAYRNAIEIYEEDYQRLFGLLPPEQLKKDLLNTAFWTGFNEEFDFYRKKFGIPDYKPTTPQAELVFFWHNGLSPVKAEWSINFLINRAGDNLMVFTNEAMGISFPFQVEKENEKSDLSSLEVFRVAFPKYVERGRYFEEANLTLDSARYKLEPAEDVNKIAFYSLEQRMMTEFGKGLLRAALKKATEHSVRQEDERLGALIGIVNAFTEQADTRNWQTLPHSIYYSRVPLKVGANEVKFTLRNRGEDINYNFTYRALPGQTLFHTFSSLETDTGYRVAGN